MTGGEAFKQELLNYTDMPCPLSAAAMADCLAQLQVDIPQKGQFIVGHKGLLFTHPRAAVVLRVESDERALTHELITPVLGQIIIGPYRLSLTAGLRSNGVRQDELNWLSETLRQDGIIWTDNEHGNGGRYPLPTTRFPEGLPAVIDNDRLKLSRSRKLLKLFNRPAAKSQTLERLGVDPALARAWHSMIHELQQSFTASLPAKGEELRINQAAIERFWQLAEEATQPVFTPGRVGLFRGWEEFKTLQPQAHEPPPEAYPHMNYAADAPDNKSRALAQASARYGQAQPT